MKTKYFEILALLNCLFFLSSCGSGTTQSSESHDKSPVAPFSLSLTNAVAGKTAYFIVQQGNFLKLTKELESGDPTYTMLPAHDLEVWAMVDLDTDTLAAADYLTLSGHGGAIQMSTERDPDAGYNFLKLTQASPTDSALKLTLENPYPGPALYQVFDRACPGFDADIDVPANSSLTLSIEGTYIVQAEIDGVLTAPLTITDPAHANLEVVLSADGVTYEVRIKS